MSLLEISQNVGQCLIIINRCFQVWFQNSRAKERRTSRLTAISERLSRNAELKSAAFNCVTSSVNFGSTSSIEKTPESNGPFSAEALQVFDALTKPDGYAREEVGCLHASLIGGQGLNSIKIDWFRCTLTGGQLSEFRNGRLNDANARLIYATRLPSRVAVSECAVARGRAHCFA